MGINQHAITRELHQLREKDGQSDILLGDAGYIFGHSLNMQFVPGALPFTHTIEDSKVRARRILNLAEKVRKKLCD